jgi:hypothetical protein
VTLASDLTEIQNAIADRLRASGVSNVRFEVIPVEAERLPCGWNANLIGGQQLSSHEKRAFIAARFEVMRQYSFDRP